MITGRKLPIGVQSYEGLIRDGYVYVDKTMYIYNLVHSGKQYFLSRPRRFGKSLLLSAFRAYWEGKKELFEGLAIESMEAENIGTEACTENGNQSAWHPHPVFYFDFNRRAYIEKDALPQMLDTILREYESVYGCVEKHRSLEERFQRLLILAHENTGKRCVILIDEYDKPLLETMENEELEEYNRKVFKGFFSTLKSFDDHIRFVFVTGVTKFSKVSIFSDLNQLEDISLDEAYSSICGITEDEISKHLMPEVHAFAEKKKTDVQHIRERLRNAYDGYHFAADSPGVYNPHSLLSALKKTRLDYYWFETGTPSFLPRRLRNMSFEMNQFMNGTLNATAETLSDYRDDNSNLIPLLYQTGYLTLVDYDNVGRYYTLGFPNEEVEYGLLNSLMPEYIPGAGSGSGKDIISIKRYLETGDVDRIRDVFTALYASIPYTTGNIPFEHDFQTVIFLVFTLLGQYVHAEVHSSQGRADALVETDAFIYLFEFKRDKSANDALQQIEDSGYAEPYAADSRKLFKIGVSFDSETRGLKEWKVELK